MRLRLMTLVGRFATESERQVKSVAEASDIVAAHIRPHGYTMLRLVDDTRDGDSVRFTARTPGGRAGRNVAFLDIGDES